MKLLPTPKRKFSHDNSHLRIILVACTMVAALVVGISLLFYQVYRSSLVEEMISSSVRTLDRTDMMISETFQQIENIGYQQTLATARLIHKSDRDLVHDYYHLQQLTDSLINMKNSHNYIHSVYIYFNQGSVIVTSFMGTTSFRLFYDTSWLDIYSKNTGETIWINSRKPYNSQYDDSQKALEKYSNDTSDVLTLLVPLSSSLRDKGGVIVVNVYEKELAKLLSEASDGTEMLMVDAAGRIVISADNQVLYTNLPETLFEQIRGTERGQFNYMDESGQEFICVYASSQFNGNYILELLPLSAVLAPTKALLRNIILYAILFLFLAVLLVVIIIYWSRRPVRQLYKELGKSLSTPDSDTNPVLFQRALSKIIQDNKTLTKLWENNRMLIKHRTLSLLLQGKMSAFNDDPKRLEFLEICFPYPYFVCCVLQLNPPQHSNVILDEQYEIIKMQLFPMLQQCLTPPISGYTVDLDDLNVALIVNVEKNSPGTLLALCQNIQKAALESQIIPYPLSVGIGNFVSDASGVALSFRQACSAVRYATTNCPGDIISFSSISVSEFSDGWAGFPDENELLDAIRIGDLSAAVQNLTHWFHRLEYARLPLESLKQITATLVGRIVNLLPEIGININTSTSAITTRLLSLKEADAIKTLIRSFVEDICSQIQLRREHKNAETMERVISYMRENYNHDISLSRLAEDVYMSVPYLCKIFKEYTNKNFTDYLASLRIEASMDLLRSSNKKIMDIAVSVGYTNAQSYIRAFKKYNNMTPSEFRESVVIPQNLK